MYSHTKRWEKAQEIEKLYWQKEHFRSSEFKELVLKYDKLFEQIEEKYQFSPDTKILDLGCGATCPSILFKNGEKYGVDPLADFFSQKDKRELAGKIELSKGSGEEVPFADDFFDVVLCRNALDHMDKVEKVMQEIRRVTARKGIIILSIYVYAPFIFFLKRLSEYIPFLRNIEHPYTFTQSGFRKLCQKHFEITEEKIILEGRNSIDYGKQDVNMVEPLFNKAIAWLNKHLFMSNWFLREYLVICRKASLQKHPI